jgi:two-component system chemotaxis response regulator CheB
MREGGVLRFRCRTGHAYTAQALLADLSTSVETLLWNAVRGLEEKTDLLRHLAGHLRQEGQAEASEDFLAQARTIEQRTGLVRQALPKENDKTETEPTL